MQNPKLTDEQKHVLFEKGTEAPFSGKFLDNDEPGIYVCANCGHELFKTDSQYETHVPGLMGWPSFADVAKAGAVKLVPDDSMGMHRTEVVCANCGAHLGHLFDDETAPTGQHYCINSLSLDFNKTDESR
jgi:peptide-methionine (R)-S-oxide reductase